MVYGLVVIGQGCKGSSIEHIDQRARMSGMSLLVYRAHSLAAKWVTGPATARLSSTLVNDPVFRARCDTSIEHIRPPSAQRGGIVAARLSSTLIRGLVFRAHFGSSFEHIRSWTAHGVRAAALRLSSTFRSSFEHIRATLGLVYRAHLAGGYR